MIRAALMRLAERRRDRAYAEWQEHGRLARLLSGSKVSEHARHYAFKWARRYRRWNDVCYLLWRLW
jgi:hypothetical protein